MKKETLQEVAEIDLTNLCYYDKRNPDCSMDDEDIEDRKKSLLKKNKTCSCDNCFYGRSDLTKQLIRQAERMYSEEEVNEIIAEAWNSCEDNEGDETFTQARDRILRQFKKK